MIKRLLSSVVNSTKVKNNKNNNNRLPEKKIKLRFSKQVLDKFKTNVGRYIPEKGGILGCTGDMNYIDIFSFDKNSKNTSASFSYDVQSMTKVYNEWKSKGYKATGFVHSHPRNCTHPSYADIATSFNLMKFFDNDFFYLPIIQSDMNGLYTMYFYVVRRKEKFLELKLEYILYARKKYCIKMVEEEIETYSVEQIEKYLGKNNYVRPKKVSKPQTQAAVEVREPEELKLTKPVETESVDTSKYFERMDGMFPENVLNKVIVVIGVGGARSLVENLARHRFYNFILIDGDIVAPSNISTQGVVIPEMGMKKVDALKKRILNINPDAMVISIDRFLDNNMSDEFFESQLAIFKDKKPTDYLIFGCTDDHPGGQSRAALLASKYGIPYIGAAVYKNGLGAEAIFTYPGVTEGGCPRCMLRQRYEAYENGFVNNVTSAGCSTFVTERLNSTLGLIALMLLMYHEDDNSPYNTMLDEVKNRTFVWIRLSPLMGAELGMRIFDKALGKGTAAERFTFFDETLWMPQHPDSPENGEETCKMCGGVTDLTLLKGKWKDTRKVKFNNDKEE